MRNKKYPMTVRESIAITGLRCRGHAVTVISPDLFDDLPYEMDFMQDLLQTRMNEAALACIEEVKKWPST